MKMLSDQYDAFERVPSLHVNGALTMGENIVDNAGIAIALKACHLSLSGKPAGSSSSHVVRSLLFRLRKIKVVWKSVTTV